MSVKMGVAIAGGFLGGRYLDQYLQLKFPVFLLVFGMIGLVLSIYIVFVDTRPKK